MSSIILFIIGIHLILLFFLGKSAIKIPKNCSFFKPLILSIISILIYTIFDILIANSGVLNLEKISFYWYISFFSSVVYNIIIASLLEGWNSLKFFIVAQLGIMVGVPDLLFYLLQGKAIPAGQLSYMPFYMNSAEKLWFNFSIIIILTILIYTLPYFINHGYRKLPIWHKGGGCKNEET